MFTAMLDTPSIEALVRMEGFSALLSPEIVHALTVGGTLLVQTAQLNTWEVFDNPTGELANSITFYLASPEEAQVRVGVPYGHRREYGFSGPDALGRVYVNDRPRPYLVPALEQHEDDIATLFEQAVNSALGRIAA